MSDDLVVFNVRCGKSLFELKIKTPINMSGFIETLVIYFIKYYFLVKILRMYYIYLINAFYKCLGWGTALSDYLVYLKYLSISILKYLVGNTFLTKTLNRKLFFVIRCKYHFLVITNISVYHEIHF